jgi:hypothetical protein
LALRSERRHVSISIANTRFSRCAHVINAELAWSASARFLAKRLDFEKVKQQAARCSA